MAKARGQSFPISHYSETSVNKHLNTTETSYQRTNILSQNTIRKKMTPPYSEHLSMIENHIGPTGLPLYGSSTVTVIEGACLHSK